MAWVLGEPRVVDSLYRRVSLEKLRDGLSVR